MIARFRRTLSKTQHRISLILIMDQDQQRIGRQRYIRREAFRSNLFGREILPTDEKLHAAFLHLCNRFQVGLLVPNIAAIAIWNAATISKTVATA